LDKKGGVHVTRAAIVIPGISFLNRSHLDIDFDLRTLIVVGLALKLISLSDAKQTT
jgi:hypothetical protein